MYTLDETMYFFHNDQLNNLQFLVLKLMGDLFFQVDDLSLRNNASNCLQKVLLKVGASLDEQPQLVDVLVNPFLRHVRQGLTIQTEV